MRQLIILAGKDGRPSMKGVYSQMKSNSELHVRRRLKKSGKEYFRIYKNHFVDAFEKRKIDDNDLTNKIVLRWGNTIPVQLQGSIVYNKAEAIQKATNKKLAREIWMQKNINCPKLITNNEEAQIALNKTKIIIARPYVHAKGKNFIILKNLQEFIDFQIANPQNWYYSEFIDKVKEYRVHVGHGRILNYLEKPKPDNGNIAWNRALNAEAFENVKWNDYNNNVCKVAIQSGKELGLDFYGADIIVDKEGNAFVLEINTSPTLASSEYSMNRYALYFDWLSKKDERREHWEFKEFKNPSNYAWHNYHFEDRNPN